MSLNVAVPRNQAALARDNANLRQLQGQPLALQPRGTENQMTVTQQHLHGAVHAREPVKGGRVNARLPVGSELSRHVGLGSAYVTGDEPKIPGPGVTQR